MDRRAFIGTVGAIATGGCLRLTGDGSASGSTSTPIPATADGTPSATPRAEDTPTPETARATPTADYPLGLTESGPEPILADNHRNTLIEDTFEVEFAIENITAGAINEHFTHIGGDTFGFEVNHETQNRLIRYATYQDTLWWREIINGNEVYGSNPWAFSKPSLTQARQLKFLLDAGVFEPPEIDRSGETSYLIQAKEPSDGTPFADWERFHVASLETYTAEGTVSAAGLITDLVAEFQWIPVDRNELLKHRIKFSVSETGLSVEKPAWLPTAKERAPRVNVTLADDRRTVTVRHRDGNAIVAGSQFAFEPPAGSRRIARIDRSFEPGDVAYLTLQDGDLTVDFGSPPAESKTTEITDEYIVYAEAGSAPYFAPVRIND